MARRGNNTAAEPTTDETVETLAEATEPTPAAEVKETKEPTPEADLTPFKAAVEAALAEADVSTGDLPKTATDSVNKVYREIDGVKGKNAARNYLDDQMKAAVVGKDIIKAKSFINLKDDLSAGSGGGSPKAPADPTEAFVQKVAALSIASVLVTSTVPEGVGEDWAEKADALVNELGEQVDAYAAFRASSDEDAEEPEVSPVVRSAFKLASGKASGGSSTRVLGGPRRDVVKHMEQVFADKEAGSFLTINEIAKSASTEYGDDRPSAGAVSARLFPKGKESYAGEVIKASAEEGKPRGAVKL